MTALGSLNKLIEAGITVITAIDEKTYTQETLDDSMQILMSVLIMARANEESQAKEKRSVVFSISSLNSLKKQVLLHFHSGSENHHQM
ncbi:TPA: hypothetical protein ACX6RK_001473 [Photobacterium damselae]